MKRRFFPYTTKRDAVVSMAIVATILVEGYRVNIGVGLLLFCCGVGLNLFSQAIKVGKP